MCRFLTSKLTKSVSFFVLMLALVATVWAQGNDTDFTSIADPTPEMENESDLDAVLATEAEQDAPAADEQANKLETIDEDEVSYQDEGRDGAEDEAQPETATPLSEEVEDLKKAALQLNRDLLILEEELLFPANSQIVIFMSLDVGKYFALDSLKVLIDDKLVASHLYTRRQNAALALGGIQRLYLGNLKSGEHEVTAFFVGMGPDNREYKRGATTIVDKSDDPLLLELKVRDATSNMQPEFEFEEWQL